jgi:hypothetical protein
MLKKTFLMLILALSFPAHADRYFAVSFGTSEADADGIEDDSAFRIGFGSKISDQFGYEVTYVDLGEFKATEEFIAELNVGNPPGLTLRSSSLSISGFDFSVFGLIPLNDKVLARGHVGLFLWDMEFKFDTNQGTFTDGDDGNGFSLGFGLDVRLSERTFLAFGYDQYEVDDGDVDSLNAGIKISF